MFGANVKTVLELNADGTAKAVKSSVVEPLLIGVVSAITSKLSADTVTTGLASTLVDVGMVYAGGVLSNYMTTGELHLFPYSPE